MREREKGGRERERKRRREHSGKGREESGKNTLAGKNREIVSHKWALGIYKYFFHSLAKVYHQ